MAHSVVVLVVRDALAAGHSADAIRSADIDNSAQILLGKPLGLPETAVAQALDPAENIRARTVLGGPAPAEMARMLAGRQVALAADAAAVAAVQGRLAAAEAGCFGLARALAG
jgi:argininosuccinate lyase